MTEKKIRLEFEVFGKVQGVFFRKYTMNKSRELSLKGWVRNTKGGTVIGIIEGQSDNVEEMKRWLQYIGSPSSKIERAEFKNEKEIDDYSFSDFNIKA